MAIRMRRLSLHGRHGARARLQTCAQRGGARQFGFLFNPAAFESVPVLQLADVQRANAGQHAQQRGLAAAVAAYESDALARLDAQLRPVEQGVIAKGELAVKECDE